MVMTEDEIRSKALDIIAKTTKVDPTHIEMKSRFVEDLGVDSMDRVNLLIEFEDAFGIKIPQEEEKRITNVQSTIELLKEHLR